jgi:hypothetical protein
MAVRVRPNEGCLYCNTVLVKNPTIHRVNYTCGIVCFRKLNRSLNYFNPEIRRRNGSSMLAVSMIWWTLSKSDTPLTHAQVQGRIRSNFGDLVIFKDKLTTTSVKFFNDESITVNKSGEPLLTPSDKDRLRHKWSYLQALRGVGSQRLSCRLSHPFFLLTGSHRYFLLQYVFNADNRSS